MFERLIRCIHGYVKIKIWGSSPERFLNLCRYHGIRIWGLCPSETTYEMYMSVREFKKLRAIGRKTHTKIKIQEKYGFPFFLLNYQKRKLFLAGFLLAIFLILQYSGFIWDIQFEGNERWTDPVLMEFLETLQISPGIKKEEIDSLMIAAEIRKEYNDIVWVSASIEGCCLFIKIKENETDFQNDTSNERVSAEKTINDSENPKDLIASEDGVITEMITRKGTPLVQIGDTVKKGDLLVCGRIEVKNDAAEIIGYQYCEADADIFADTAIKYNDSADRFYKEKMYLEQTERRKWYVNIGKILISAGTDKSKTDNFKEIFQEEYQIKLGENFYLPISYGIITSKGYKEIEKTYTNEELEEILSQKIKDFLKELEKKGIQIRENNVKIRCYENNASAKGIIHLNQRITESADTEIMEIERNELNEFSRTVN